MKPTYVQRKVNTNLDKRTFEQFHAYAVREGLTPAQVVRQAITELLARVSRRKAA